MTTLATRRLYWHGTAIVGPKGCHGGPPTERGRKFFVTLHVLDGNFGRRSWRVATSAEVVTALHAWATRETARCAQNRLWRGLPRKGHVAS
jgi:hypothetical protein